jgi:hypothetical protein
MDASNCCSLPEDETEPIDDPFTNTLSAKDMNRLFMRSKYDRVGLSTKIHQIIKDHLDWHAYAPDAKMLYMPKPWISKIVNQLTEQQIISVAKDVSIEFKNICLMLRGEFDFLSFLDVVVTWLRINGTPSRQVQNPEDYRLLLKHDMGYNYSLFLKEIFRRIITDDFRIEMESIITENTLAIRISMTCNPLQALEIDVN